MSNTSIRNEAKRVALELINIGESNDSLDVVFHSILREEFKEYDLNVLVHISEELIDKKYIIKNTNPFKLGKI